MNKEALENGLVSTIKDGAKPEYFEKIALVKEQITEIERLLNDEFKFTGRLHDYCLFRHLDPLLKEYLQVEDAECHEFYVMFDLLLRELNTDGGWYGMFPVISFTINTVRFCAPDFFISALKQALRERQIQPKERVPTKTYLMKDDATNLYKIGRSKNVDFREKTLGAATPLISLVAFCEKNHETHLHNLFKAQRIRGEWFELTPDDIRFVLDLFAKG